MDKREESLPPDDVAITDDREIDRDPGRRFGPDCGQFDPLPSADFLTGFDPLPSAGFLSGVGAGLALSAGFWVSPQPTADTVNRPSRTTSNFVRRIRGTLW